MTQHITLLKTLAHTITGRELLRDRSRYAQIQLHFEERNRCVPRQIEAVHLGFWPYNSGI